MGFNKKVIILIGPPGAGKGTQGELLAEKTGLFYFESSKVIETNVKQAKEVDSVVINGQEYLLAKEKQFFDNGILNTPEVVAFWVGQEIKKIANQGKGLILAGSPRTIYEGKKIIPLLKKLYGIENIQVILIRLSPKESISRNIKRKICSSCRHPVSYVGEIKKSIRCPKCGGRLTTRGDLDKEETIKTRLKEYKKRTMPLVEYFKQEDLLVDEVDGEQSIKNVHRDILKNIKYRWRVKS